MKKYIGSKIIRAEKMDECTYLEKYKGEDVSQRETCSGYLVKYPDGYLSWSPKEVFESAYREITLGELDLLVDADPEAKNEDPIEDIENGKDMAG